MRNYIKCVHLANTSIQSDLQFVTEPTIFEITSLISQLLLLDKSEIETLLKSPDEGVSPEKKTPVITCLL